MRERTKQHRFSKREAVAGKRNAYAENASEGQGRLRTRKKRNFQRFRSTLSVSWKEGTKKKSFKLELGFMRGLSDSGGGGGTKKVSADRRPGSCVRISFFIFAFLRTLLTTPEHCLSVGNERYE